MTEKEYRKLKRGSYSATKMFDTDRIKYYKKYELGDKSMDEEPSTVMKLGSVVDCKLFSLDEFDDNFVIATCIAPSGQMGLFTEELCTLTLQSLNDELVVTRDIKELMEEAFNNVKFDKKGKEANFKGKNFEYLVNNFVGTPAEEYYKTCRSNFGKTVVDMNLLTAADKIIEELKICEWTKDIILAKTEGDIEIIDQLGLLFEVEGEPFKGRPDRVIINHSDKEVVIGSLVLPPKSITPYDLKISYSGEDFQYNYWKMKYYLQVASYFLGLHYYKTVLRKELMNYTIPGIEFIVGSSNLLSNPLLFSTNQVNISEGLMGFVTKSGRKYKGLYELNREIKWHRTNQLWRNSKEVYDNSGKMVIRPFEEVQE